MPDQMGNKGGADCHKRDQEDDNRRADGHLVLAQPRPGQLPGASSLDLLGGFTFFPEGRRLWCAKCALGRVDTADAHVFSLGPIAPSTASCETSTAACRSGWAMPARARLNFSATSTIFPRYMTAIRSLT